MKGRLLSVLMKFWTIFIGIGAVVGAVMMWTDPSGRMFQMESILEMLRDKMPWPDIFFRDFIPSSFVLLAVNGLPQFTAAVLLFRKNKWASLSTLICGVILMCWIILEWCIFGFYGICNAFFVFGLLEAFTAIATLMQEKKIVIE